MLSDISVKQYTCIYDRIYTVFHPFSNALMLASVAGVLEAIPAVTRQ